MFIDTTRPCKPIGSCSFEDSLCNWSQFPTNKFNLLRITSQQLQTLQSSIYQPIPTFDTTTNTKYGHFLWISPVYQNLIANQSTNIYSETFLSKNYQSNTCFTFMYFMNGP